MNKTRVQDIPLVKSIKVGNEVLNVDELLKRDYDDIREASELLPAAMAWLGWQRAAYQEQLYNAEVKYKTTKSTTYLALKSEGGMEAYGYRGKATEAAIEHILNLDDSVLEAQRAYAKVQRFVSCLTAYIYALERKIELVRSGEATHRKVADNEALTNEELEARVNSTEE